jgi:hypothetical protein
MDLKLFTLINSLAHKSPVLDSLMIISSKYLPIFFDEMHAKHWKEN